MKSFCWALIFLVVFEAVGAKLVLPLSHHRGLRSQLLSEGKHQEYEALLRKLKPHEKLTNTVALFDYFDDFFSHYVQIGTPAQTLILRPDTSGGDLWFMDKNKCTASQCLGFPSLTSNFNRTLFDSTKSSTYKVVRGTNNFASGGICYNGTLSSDLITLPNFGPITQQFGLCYVVDNFMGLHPFDGYLGLGWPALATDNVTPLFQNMIANGSVTKPVFSVYMANSNNGSITYGRDTAGSITYGGLDSYNCDTKISYVPLSSKTYWQFTMSGFTFGSFSVNKNQQALVSTAQAIVILPDSVLSNIVTIINATFHPIVDGAQYLVPCDQAPGFPSLTFNIGGSNYMVPGVNYVQPINMTHCALRIESSSTFGFGPAWVLGTPFIRNYCVHHDVGQSRIGFSQQTPMHICC